MSSSAALMGVSIALACALVVQSWLHQRERSTWAVERRQLVDRAIARHTGEILALDRGNGARPKAEGDEPRLIEGLT